MRFTIAPTELLQLLDGAGITKPKKDATLVLSACAARIFVEFKGEVAGIESVILSDGAVTLPALKFRELIKTYQSSNLLTFEGGPNGSKIQNFTMPVLSWNPKPPPPANVQVFVASGMSTLLPSGNPGLTPQNPPGRI
jgi:hypothetical protein